jgi:hypothetical protein
LKTDDLVKLAEVAARPESAADFPGLRSLKRRVMRARNFPTNTTPASRHLHTIALALVNRERYAMLEEEPIHCGETMLCVLLDLWKTKTKLARLEGRA